MKQLTALWLFLAFLVAGCAGPSPQQPAETAKPIISTTKPPPTAVYPAGALRPITSAEAGGQSVVGLAGAPVEPAPPAVSPR